MSKTKTPAAELTFREKATAISKPKIDAMVAEIQASVDRRHAFELANGGIGGSWAASKKMIAANERTIAAFFITLGVKPAAVFERQLVEGKMFNAKSIKKVVEMAKFALDGGVSRVEKVIQSFIACALIANDRSPGDDPITFTNGVNAKFLNRADLGTYIKDADLLEAIEEQRHTAMSTGAATQSSQMRNVLDVLGLGKVVKVERERDAVLVDYTHPFFAGFREKYLKAAA